MKTLSKEKVCDDIHVIILLAVFTGIVIIY